MENDIIIGIDLAKNVFQVHGAYRDGTVLFRKKLTRPQFKRFLSAQDPCLVAMEACGTSHYWAREFTQLGHDVRLIPPMYVKAFVKRQKNDAADAEAICEAASRPNMSFVEPKSAATQAMTMMMRTREQFIRQRTATVNTLRGHMAEFGLIVPVGIRNVPRLSRLIEEASDLPDLAVKMARLHMAHIEGLTRQVDDLSKQVADHSASSKTARFLRTMPGIGPIAALVIEAFSPDASTFATGRDFAAWLGLIPKQNSTGGKTRLGKVMKGQTDIRRVLITGAMSRIASHARHNKPAEPWLQDKLERKPRMIAAIALANKMARLIWAMLTKKEAYNTSGIITA